MKDTGKFQFIPGELVSRSLAEARKQKERRLRDLKEAMAALKPDDKSGDEGETS